MNIIYSFIVAVATMLPLSILSAAGSPTYAGVGGLYVNLDNYPGDEGYGYNLLLGRRVNDNLAIEAGYMYASGFGTIGGTQELFATYAAVVVRTSLDQHRGSWHGFLRLGMARWEARFNGTFFNTTDSGSDLMYGVGLEMKTSANTAVEISYQNVASGSSTTYDAMVLMVGSRWHF